VLHSELISLHANNLLPFGDGYTALRSGAAWRLQEAAVFRISGSDRRSWLQGQVTNDVERLLPGEHVRCCVLAPTGQIIADCLISANEDTDVLVADGDVRERLLNRLEMTIILEDVTINDLSDSPLVHIAGPEASGEIKNPRLRSGGFDSMTAMPTDLPSVDDDAWELARIEDGYPLAGKDFTEKTLVMEMGPGFVASRVSFSKGCYTGQEIVERISARGHTNKQWVRLDAESVIYNGDSIVGGGVVTSSAGLVAAGFVRNEALTAGRVVVESTSGPVSATVTEV